MGKLEAAVAQKASLMHELNGVRLSRDDVLQAHKARVERQLAAASSSLPENPRVRLAEALLCYAVAVKDALGCSVPAILCSSGKGKAPVASLRVPGTDKAIATLRREIATLTDRVQADQPLVDDWSVHGSSFKLAVSTLRASKRALLRVEIEKIQKEFIWFDSRFTRRGELLSQERSKKLRAAKAAREKQLLILLSLLLAWENGGFASLPDESTFNARTVTLSQLLAGVLPWSPDFGWEGPYAPVDPLGGSVTSRAVLTSGKEALGCAFAVCHVLLSAKSIAAL